MDTYGWGCANLLDCGILDLAELDNCQMDIRDIANRYIQKCGTMPTLNDLIEEIFIEGIDIIFQAYINRIEAIKEKKQKGIKISEKEWNDLNQLSFSNDFNYTANCLASDIYITNNAEIYHTYFQKEIDQAEELMGYEFTE